MKLSTFGAVLSRTVLAAVAGCDAFVAQRRAPLFMTPLTVDGVDVGEAIVDTGGAYEVILRDDFGLEIVDTVEVLGFSGPEQVAVTEPFPFSAGGVFSTADFALVGLSACECNGVGYRFFRKTETVLGLDFSTLTAEYAKAPPPHGATIEFADPPAGLSDFDSSFMEVDVVFGGVSKRLLGLLDTGTNGTALRRGLFTPSSSNPTNQLSVTIARVELGTVALSAILFDTEGLPDIILGTDVMGAWSDRWYFTFNDQGGTITVIPRSDEAGPQ